MRIFKSSIVKKILGIVAIMGCTGVFFNGYVGVNEAQAKTEYQDAEQLMTQEEAPTTDTSTNSLSTMGLRQILDMVLKIIYLLLRPLLVVAGLALDNTLVYASVFHLDAPLWKFWNMMKNFANFTLGFMVLFAIIKSILTNSGEGSLKDEKSPLGIIKVTLIAGILIQASRFLLAALVDVSTVATYAVGGLPLSVLKNTDIGNKKILSVNSSIDLNKFDVLSTKGENFRVWYSTSYKMGNTTKKVEFSPCRIEEGYIVGREYTEEKFRNSDIFGPGQSACVAFGNQIVIYNEAPSLRDKNGTDYKLGIDDLLGCGSEACSFGTWLQSCGYIIPLNPDKNLIGTCGERFSEIYDWFINYGLYPAEDFARLNDSSKRPTNTPRSNSKIGMQGGTTWFESGNVLAMTISDLIKKSRGFVGPLVTMYSSLLNFAQLTDSNVTTIGETSGVFLIKTGVAIALFFPLIALAMVLIARIGILRLYIVASPFIVIKACFSKFIEMKSLDKYLNIKSVMGIVFAPVITVAALSISLIFMTALVNGFQSTSSRDEINQTLRIQQIEPIKSGNDAIIFNDIAQLEFTKLPWGEAMDRFSRLMVNFFAIGLMRMIFFAALKANALGEKIGGEVQNFGSNVFRTLPILPLGEGGAKVGIGSAYNVFKGAPSRRVGERESEQKRIATEYVFGPEGGGTAGGTPVTLNATQVQTVIPSATATSKEITAAVEKLRVEPANVSTVLTGNTGILAQTISGMKLTETQEKALAKEINIASDNKLGNDRLTKAQKNTVTKTQMDAVDKIVTTGNPTDKTTLEKLFTDANDLDKTAIEAYFKASINELGTAGNTYMTSDAKYKVTQTLDTKNAGKFIYTVEEIIK